MMVCRASFVGGKTQIVDGLHARGHLGKLARKLHLNDENRRNRWMLVVKLEEL